MAAGKKLDVAFLRLADERYPELLSEAARAFPQSTAVRFWMKYIDWAELDEESISVEECKQLLQEDPTVLVPATVVFGVSDGHEMRSEARQLLRQCKKSGTTGALYVASVIDAVMTRVGHR